MRKIVLLLIFAISSATTAEIEEILTTDGKRLVGYYNPKTERILLTHRDLSQDEVPSSVNSIFTIISLPAKNITERKLFKNSEDPMNRLRKEMHVLDAERQKYQSQAADARKAATIQGKDQAELSLNEAMKYERLAESIIKVISRIDAQVKAFEKMKDEITKDLPRPIMP